MSTNLATPAASASGPSIPLMRSYWLFSSLTASVFPSFSSKSSTPVPAPAADDEFAGFSDEQRAAAARDPDYAEALRRQMEQEAARLQCSIDNKEACVMCSG